MPARSKPLQIAGQNQITFANTTNIEGIRICIAGKGVEGRVGDSVFMGDVPHDPRIWMSLITGTARGYKTRNYGFKKRIKLIPDFVFDVAFQTVNRYGRISW